MGCHGNIIDMYFVNSYAWTLHDLLGFMFICYAVKQFKGFLTYLWVRCLILLSYSDHVILPYIATGSSYDNIVCL